MAHLRGRQRQKSVNRYDVAIVREQKYLDGVTRPRSVGGWGWGFETLEEAKAEADAKRPAYVMDRWKLSDGGKPAIVHIAMKEEEVSP